MAKDKQTLEQLGYMYQRTAFIQSMAREVGDEFLDYVYSMALRDLEQKLGKCPEHEVDEARDAVDPQIHEMAQKIISGPSTRR